MWGVDDGYALFPNEHPNTFQYKTFKGQHAQTGMIRHGILFTAVTPLPKEHTHE
jgi:hypothetical protein